MTPSLFLRVHLLLNLPGGHWAPAPLRNNVTYLKYNNEPEYEIILSAVLYKDNLSLISILLCLYFHQRFTEMARSELLATTGHFGTATEAGRAHQTKFGR